MTLARRATGTCVALTVATLLELTSVPAHARTLSFDERVTAQKAIEQVYWSHRIWPKDNPGSKPALASVMPDEAIRSKVEDYLRKSNALERWWRRPVTGEQLQAELNRMATTTRDARMLRELYRALGDDAFVIAETLARQTLVDRLVRDWYSDDARFHGGARSRAEAALSGCSDAGCMKTLGGTYQETTWKLRAEGAIDHAHGRAVSLQTDEWEGNLERLATRFRTSQDSLPIGRLSGLEETSDEFLVTAVLVQRPRELVTASVTWPKRSFDNWWAAERGNVGTAASLADRKFTTPTLPVTTCTNDTWSLTGSQVPDPRLGHTAVWTGSEMIVWGGSGLNTGARYNPAVNSWTFTSTGANVPTARVGHTAVWTGTEMIVWGSGSVNTGGRYNPSTDAWLPTSTGAFTPAARTEYAAVWTGTEMIVWGGDNGSAPLNTGGRYNPTTDSWLSTSIGANTPTSRRKPTAVWTGSRMVIWGGNAGPRTGPLTLFNTGGQYDPTTDSWTPTSTGSNVPAGRDSHTAVWTGTEMIVWGGIPAAQVFNSGGRYNPASDSWIPTSTGTNVPAGRYDHTAVWTGTEMIVWGGELLGFGGTTTNSGARYDPASDSWAATSAGAGVPEARRYHTAVWTGVEMIVWGGRDIEILLSTGGRYDPSSDSWVATPTGSIPAPRYQHSAVWTGAEMIVWGGRYANSNGGRYDPATNSWAPVSGFFLYTYDSPAVWTGTEMISWGAWMNGIGKGGRYNPLTDTWAATSLVNAPQDRHGHTAVWTGTEMIVWGGLNDSLESTVDTGGRYNPSTDTWRPTSTGNHPDRRFEHTAVWTGTEMIIWGGNPDGDVLNTGGRYDPVSDRWTPTSTGANVPSARWEHTAVWTGTEMIVWGGGADNYLDTGGRYDPVTDAWTPTSIGTNVPTARSYHTAVWTGSAMIVWGGISYNGSSMYLNSGGRYNPVTAKWTPTSTGENVPSSRAYTTAVWTGAEMIVWGGYPLTATGGRYCADPCAACDDNNACTDDSCDGASGCVHTPVVCNDYNACTDDSCNPASGCVHTPNISPCDDGNVCTTGDVCSGGTCQGAPAVVCNDGNPCTDDSCNPAWGCVHTDNTATCDDGSLCTTNDTCVNGACIGHSSLNESDPRSVGYWKDLCLHAHSGDMLTDADAQCVADTTASFDTHTVASLCAILARYNGGDTLDDDGFTWGTVSHPSTCDRARAELLALALNRCRGRVCGDQQIDSGCDPAMTMADQSFTQADSLISGSAPESVSCRASRCLARELDSGHALEVDDMHCDRDDTQHRGAMRCHWSVPLHNDGTAAPRFYEIYRRPRGTGAFSLVSTVSSTDYYVEDPDNDYEYEVKPVR